MSLLINELLNTIREEYKKSEPEWTVSQLIEDDLLFLDEECNKESEFDPERFRQTKFTNFIHGIAPYFIVKCPYGQVFVIYEEQTQSLDIPWGLWARILRLHYEKKKKPFKIFFLGNIQKREFPKGSEEIKPQNINGGYTYRCNPETIMIYRAEDATRVLIHELLHSCCLDNPENDIDTIEAETEAWAELLYVGFLSRGKKYIFNDLLQRQSEWMRKQNEEVIKHMKNPDSREFPWRYTLGKEAVWKRWGILKENNVTPFIDIKKSLRLTYPPSNTLKQQFKVRKDSTIL
jgi:hypothetical protein